MKNELRLAERADQNFIDRLLSRIQETYEVRVLIGGKSIKVADSVTSCIWDKTQFLGMSKGEVNSIVVKQMAKFKLKPIDMRHKIDVVAEAMTGHIVENVMSSPASSEQVDLLMMVSKEIVAERLAEITPVPVSAVQVEAHHIPSYIPRNNIAEQDNSSIDDYVVKPEEDKEQIAKMVFVANLNRSAKDYCNDINPGATMEEYAKHLADKKGYSVVVYEDYGDIGMLITMQCNNIMVHCEVYQDNKWILSNQTPKAKDGTRTLCTPKSSSLTTISL